MSPFEFILDLLLFIIACFLAFYIPGKIIVKKISSNILLDSTISIVVGMVLWVIQGTVFGYLNLRNLAYLYLLIFLILYIKIDLKKLYFKFNLKKIKEVWLEMIIILTGTIAQNLTYFRMGWKTLNGVIITSYNPPDHVWHAALVKELINKFPPNEPSISNVTLKDYHYFYNLLAADLIKVFHLPFFESQFMGFYPLASILLGIIGYGLANKIYPKKIFTRFFLFLLYFSGSAIGWVLLIIRHKFIWNVPSIINDTTKFLDSPAYALAVVLGLTGLFILLSNKNLSKRLIIICSLIFGTLLEFKVYVGITFLLLFGTLSVLNLFRKNKSYFISFLLAVSLAFIFLKLNSSSSTGLSFLPFEIPRNFINGYAFPFQDWLQRWQIYSMHNNKIRLLQYGLMMSVIYLSSQFGIQLIGFIPYKKTLTVLGKDLYFSIYISISAAFLLGFLFYQTVGGANIWEFFTAAIPLLDILFGLTFILFIENFSANIKCILIFICIILLIPQFVFSLNKNINTEFLSGFHGITNSLLDSYSYINNNTPKDSIIMINGNFPWYVSDANLFINRSIYFSGYGVRQIITPEITKRLKEIKIVTKSKNPNLIKDTLKEEKIHYIYFYNKPLYPKVLAKAGLHIVFSNKAATIFYIQ